jgi:hypothetical protein
MTTVDVQIIAALGKALYGEWWRNETARALGVHASTIGRWLHGIGEPDIDDLHRLMSVARTRYEAILAAYEVGQQALRLPNPPPQRSTTQKTPAPALGSSRSEPTLPAWKARQQP